MEPTDLCCAMDASKYWGSSGTKMLGVGMEKRSMSSDRSSRVEQNERKVVIKVLTNSLSVYLKWEAMSVKSKSRPLIQVLNPPHCG